MSATSANLASLLQTKADITYYTQQMMFWTNKYDANAAKLQQQVKYETKWESAFDKAIDNKSVLEKGGVRVEKDNQCEDIADAYAHACVEEYDEEMSLELADKDFEYESMKTMYETLLEEMRAREESEKQLVSDSASDTGLLNQ